MAPVQRTVLEKVVNQPAKIEAERRGKDLSPGPWDAISRVAHNALPAVAGGIAGLWAGLRMRPFDRGEPRNGSVAHERLEGMSVTDTLDRSFTRETLPPARPAVEAILRRVQETARRFKEEDDQAGAVGSIGSMTERIVPSDTGKPRIKPIDKGKRPVKLT